MRSETFRLGLIQMEVKGGDKKWNVQHALDLISEAASTNTDIVLLPECMDLGWTDPSSLNMAEGIPEGAPCRALIEAAKRNEIYICSGLTEKQGSNIYNSAILIDKQGQVLIKHRKLNELAIGHQYYGQGDRLGVVQTEFGAVGLMICADGFARDRVLARALCYMGADVILSPCAWAVSTDHDNQKDPYADTWLNEYVPVAREFATTIVGVSNVGQITDGPWKGKICIGCSLAISSSGEEIIQGPYGAAAECILYADLKLAQRPARGAGWTDYWMRNTG